MCACCLFVLYSLNLRVVFCMQVSESILLVVILLPNSFELDYLKFA